MPIRGIEDEWLRQLGLHIQADNVATLVASPDKTSHLQAMEILNWISGTPKSNERKKSIYAIGVLNDGSSQGTGKFSQIFVEENLYRSDSQEIVEEFVKGTVVIPVSREFLSQAMLAL